LFFGGGLLSRHHAYYRNRDNTDCGDMADASCELHKYIQNITPPLFFELKIKKNHISDYHIMLILSTALAKIKTL
jgi:hypothetical protein